MKNTNFIPMNLQLFAVQTTVLADLSPEMKTFYDKKLVIEAGPNLVHMQFGQKRPIPKGGGKKIQFSKFNSLKKATTPITEGVTPGGSSLKVTSVEAEVKQYGDFVSLSDVLQLTAVDPVLVETTMLIGKQAGLTMDTVVRDILNTGTNVTYCPKRSGAGVETPVTMRSGLDNTCQLTVKVIQQVVAKLRAQNAPTMADGCYVGIIHPYVAYDLMQDKDWKDWNQYTSPEKMYKGEIGKIGGVRFVETSEAKIPENGVFSTLILGQNAYGTTELEGGGLRTIVKQLGSAGSADPLDQRSSVGWKAMLTAKILVEPYMCRIESKSAAFTDAKAN